MNLFFGGVWNFSNYSFGYTNFGCYFWGIFRVCYFWQVFLGASFQDMAFWNVFMNTI